MPIIDDDFNGRDVRVTSDWDWCIITILRNGCGEYHSTDVRQRNDGIAIVGVESLFNDPLD